MNPWLAMAAVLVLLSAAMLGVRWASRKFAWHPELSRKAIHVFMGLVCLTFPWVFLSSWPVWLLAGLSAAGLAAVRSIPALRARLGGVLGGVERQSWGELLYAPSVAFVFWLSRGDPLSYTVPVLVLALADAAGALIGRRYGFVRYETDDGVKSLEGSSGFFMTAFMATHIPLLLWTSVGRLESILISVVMGLLLMMIEAIAWRGLDNLFVPLVTYICWVRMLPLSALQLYGRLAVLVILLTLLSFWRRFTRFTQSAMIGATLVLYVSWAVGKNLWLIAPLSALFGYTLLCRGKVSNPKPHTVHTIAWIGGTGLCWLCLAEVTGTVNTIYAYGVGYACHLGMIALVYFADERRALSIPVASVKAAASGFIIPAIPGVITWRENPNVWTLTAWALLLIVTSVAVFGWVQPSLRKGPSDGGRWVRQGLIAAVASAIAFAIISIIEPWSTSFE